MTIIRNKSLVAPNVTPLASSILDHATVVNADSPFGLRAEDGVFASYSMIGKPSLRGICPPDDTPVTYASPEWIPAFSFAYETGVECSAVGNPSDLEENIIRAYDHNEGRGLEQALRYIRFAPVTSGDDVPWEDPLDITAGMGTTVITPAIALAKLEGWAAVNYNGVPTIHMPRALATLLGDRIVWRDGKAYTRNGSKVVIGGGYDDEDLENDVWMYATGEVLIERGSAHSYNLVTIPGDGSADVGLGDNREIALVQRMYRIAVDGFVIKVKANLR